MATAARQVHPRIKNNSNKTGIGMPSSHNSTQPTLPSRAVGETLGKCHEYFFISAPSSS
jgi:acid phosphatase family membrane protein YuiD